MSPIQLYLDHTRILKPAPEHMLLDSISNYVPAYARMVEAIHADPSLTVIVRHLTCAAWLQAAQEKYSPECIQAETISHRGRLAELWGAEVPDWVTNEAIAHSGLTDAARAEAESVGARLVDLERLDMDLRRTLAEA